MGQIKNIKLHIVTDIKLFIRYIHCIKYVVSTMMSFRSFLPHHHSNIVLLLHVLVHVLTTCVLGQLLPITTVVEQKEDTTPIDQVKAPICMHVEARGYLTLRGGVKSGRFTKHKNVHDAVTCLDECCQDETCNVMYMPGVTCYTVSCKSEYLCDAIEAQASSLPAEDVQIFHIIRNKGDMLDDDLLKRNQWKRDAVNNAMCSPPCKYGACVNVNVNNTSCKCDFGWKGKTCNVSFMEQDNDDDLKEGDYFGNDDDDVYFQRLDSQPDTQMKMSENKVTATSNINIQNNNNNSHN